MRVKVALLAGVLGGLLVAGTAHAQLLDKKAISLAEAEKMVKAAEAEAKKNNWGMCITVVDEGGNQILAAKMDDCQVGSVEISLRKAVTAARFKRPTKVWEDALTGNPSATPPVPGRMAILGLGFIPSEGGINLVVGGRTIGAIGCSGGTAPQDGMTCKAGADVLMK
jgi:uncharacterized protein GlcG (DUF336 family)